LPIEFAAWTALGTSIYTAAALANAPTGGGGLTAAAIATAVWQDTVATDFNKAGSIGASLGQAWTALGTPVFNAAALVNAPSGGSGGATAGQIATAVWQDATLADFQTAGSIGKSLAGLFTSLGASSFHLCRATNRQLTCRAARGKMLGKRRLGATKMQLAFPGTGSSRRDIIS
jgi:hypothetical protein